jgi:hypothetical protein
MINSSARIAVTSERARPDGGSSLAARFPSPVALLPGDGQLPPAAAPPARAGGSLFVRAAADGVPAWLRVRRRPSRRRRDGRLHRLAGDAAVRVLVACEFSGAVRDAFAARGHDAWSCDLLPSETPGNHIQGDVLDILDRGWNLMIAHPPCTHLAVSGARWFKDKRAEQEQALAFVRALMAAPIRRWCIENPVSIISSAIRRPTQVIQPWQFGHGEVKATCLWLNGLMPLRTTQIVTGRVARVHRMPPGPTRWKERSRTFAGIAEAMAEQWGGQLQARAA